jgi:hypothetical protein
MGVAEGCQRHAGGFGFGHALLLEIVDLFLEMGRKLVDDPPLGSRIKVEMRLHFIEVEADLAVHRRSLQLSAGFITRAIALEKLCHIASFCSRSALPASVMT